MDLVPFGRYAVAGLPGLPTVVAPGLVPVLGLPPIVVVFGLFPMLTFGLFPMVVFGLLPMFAGGLVFVTGA